MRRRRRCGACGAAGVGVAESVRGATGFMAASRSGVGDAGVRELRGERTDGAEATRDGEAGLVVGTGRRGRRRGRRDATHLPRARRRVVVARRGDLRGGRRRRRGGRHGGDRAAARHRDGVGDARWRRRVDDRHRARGDHVGHAGGVVRHHAERDADLADRPRRLASRARPGRRGGRGPRAPPRGWRRTPGRRRRGAPRRWRAPRRASGSALRGRWAAAGGVAPGALRRGCGGRDEAGGWAS